MNVAAKPWKDTRAPKRVLAIRLQAMGDVVITLPYLQYLRKALPRETVLDFLTREEVKAIPEGIQLFDHVYTIGGGRDFKQQFIYTCLLLPKLVLRHYDVIIDLQNNLLSRMVRKTIMPRAWAEFDRYSPRSAGERNRLTIEAVGLGTNDALTDFKLRSDNSTTQVMESNGWKPGADIVILNPAGAFQNRNWPIERYAQFAGLWSRYRPNSQFLILGIDTVAEKAKQLQSMLGARLINLVNKTTAISAFAIIQESTFVLSEDSGLMHMAWVSGIPTLCLFGSTRSDWSRPVGAHTRFFDSSDMACGNCMLASCLYTDERMNLCMNRLTPELVFEKAMELMNQEADRLPASP